MGRINARDAGCQMAEVLPRELFEEMQRLICEYDYDSSATGLDSSRYHHRGNAG